MNVVVIGGAGFIGSHLVDRLLAEDHTVDVIDNLTVGSLANLAAARSSGGALRIHHLDAASTEASSSIGIRRPDVIFHLALLPRHDSSAAAQGDAFVSALSTLEAARLHGVAKVIVAIPASAIYGHPTTKMLPAKEGEPSQLEPLGVRGVVACSIVDLLVSYRDLHAIEFTALALGSVYGPRQRPTGGVVAAFLDSAVNGRSPVVHGDGRQTRDFVFIDDVVDALVRAAGRGSGLVINVGTGEQTSVATLWSRIAASVPGAADLEPTHGPARLHDVQRFAVSPVRARIHLGWSPWTGLDDGLVRLLE
ncbi:MAG TPA: NAD-dependent epimerase/dehydratase family protein [Ilumatobacteraceae bacterium]|nr:NAD-dependent epimerase/dehydratase family protein [Ilumatobacteraceae bacterium]